MKEKAHVIFEAHKTFFFAFWPTIAHAEQRDDRRNVQKRKRFRVSGGKFARGDQIFENARVIVDYSVYVPPRKQRGEFGRAELLDREHFSEARNHGIVQGIFENLPHLFKKRGFGDLLEMRKILRRVLHVDIDSVRAGQACVFNRRQDWKNQALRAAGGGVL